MTETSMTIHQVKSRSSGWKLCRLRGGSTDPPSLGQDGQAGHHARPPHDGHGQPLPHRGRLHGAGLEQVNMIGAKKILFLMTLCLNQVTLGIYPKHSCQD